MVSIQTCCTGPASVMSGMGNIVPETVTTLWCRSMIDSILVNLGNGVLGMAGCLIELHLCC